MSLCNNWLFPIVPKKHPAYFPKVSLSIVLGLNCFLPSKLFPILWPLSCEFASFFTGFFPGLVQIQSVKFLIQYLEQQQQITLSQSRVPSEQSPVWPCSSYAPDHPAWQTLSCCVFHLGEWHCLYPTSQVIVLSFSSPYPSHLINHQVLAPT